MFASMKKAGRWFKQPKTSQSTLLQPTTIQGHSSGRAWVKSLAPLLIVLAIIMAGAVPAHAQDGSGGMPAPIAESVAQDINQMRALNGIAPLTLQPLLIQAAQSHVDDMAANNNYSHTGSDGSSVATRVARTGFQSRAGVSENWVAVSDPSGAISWWMNSYVHRTNLLNPKWTHLGVGGKPDPRNGMTIFVAVFGSDAGGSGEAVVAAASAPAPAPVESVPSGGMNYTIRPGDTLMSVALRYGLNWRNITAINGLSEEGLLQIGQVIRLPGVGDAIMGTGGPVTTSIPESLKTVDYVVRSGDTLISIGVRAQQEWRTIAAINGLGEQSVLRIGQLLKVPASDQQLTSASTTTTRTATARSHTVQPGETVITIALQYGLNWKSLLAFNGLEDDTLIAIGQTLRLP